MSGAKVSEVEEERRGYKTLILEAQLLASTPEQVSRWFESRAAAKESRFQDDSDLATEKALLARKEPIIDLTLARFTSQSEIAREMFDRGENKTGGARAVRLAVLTNERLCHGFLSQLPQVLFDRNEEAVFQWMTKATGDELVALFRNPTIDNSFLRELLEGKAPWVSLSEQVRLTAVFALSRNPRMQQSYEGSMDGWAEYSHGAVFNAGWGLADTVPTTKIWASALNELYGFLSRESFLDKDPLEIAKRWFSEKSDEKVAENEKSSNKSGYLDDYQGVRAGLARLALSKKWDLGKVLLESDDLPFRVAAYSDSDLSTEQIKKAFEKDGAVALNYLIHNEKLWREEKTRKVLHDISWQAVREDKSSDLMSANIYNGVREQMERKNPKWFLEDDAPPPIPEAPKMPELPATKADIHMLVEAIGVRGDSAEPILSSLRQMEASLRSLSGSVGWIWWFSLGALVATVWHHL